MINISLHTLFKYFDWQIITQKSFIDALINIALWLVGKEINSKCHQVILIQNCHTKPATAVLKWAIIFCH